MDGLENNDGIQDVDVNLGVNDGEGLNDDYSSEEGLEEGTLEGEGQEGQQDDLPPDGDGQEGEEGQQSQGIKFTEEQQAYVNEIVQTRLERAERAMERKLTEAAGTQLDFGQDGGEMLGAAKLWGFLKLNPELSQQIDNVINRYVANGRYNQPQQASSQQDAIELREAVYDLRLNDKVFNKNHKQVFEWADDNGYEIRTPKELQLAYKAWKADNMQAQLATQRLLEQRKAQTKANMRSRAVLEGGKTRGKGQANYQKMSDSDILASEGLSLFIED